MPGHRPPELLRNDHVVERFTCRSAEQTSWLRRHARQSAATGTTKVFVVTPRGQWEQHLIPELEPCPTDELHLVLLMKDARRTLRG